MKKFLMYTKLAIAAHFLYALQIHATFPCPHESPTIPIGSQTTLGFSGKDALSNLLADSNTISLRWYYHTPTFIPYNPMVANISFKPSQDTVTVHRDLGGENCYAIETTLVIEGHLELKINDIGINVHCPASITMTEWGSARLQTDTGRVPPYGPTGEYCAALAQLPGALLSDEHGSQLIIDIKNHQFNGEITRDYLIPQPYGREIRVLAIASVGEGLGWDWLKPGYSPR